MQVPLFPEQASNFAKEMDLLYGLLVFLTVLFGCLVFFPLVYLVFKYRVGSKADRRKPAFHNLKLELAWSIIPLLLSLPVFFWAAALYVDMYTDIEADDALDIAVVGKQWMWHLQHPTGQRENNELHIPAGRPIKLTMISQDVIHSFYVPAFRIKKDVLPGKYTTQWFIATKPGRYRLYCAEYCGTKHSEMTGYVYVQEPKEYEQWLKETTWGIRSKIEAETMEQAGERLYQELQCAGCHDNRDKAPTLFGLYGAERTLIDGRKVVADDAYIRQSIYAPETMKVTGYDPIMPTFRGRVDEQQVMQLIAYIRSLEHENAKEGAK